MFIEKTSKDKEQFGWIEVICGSMFSGKTEELIRRIRRAELAKQKIKIFGTKTPQKHTERLAEYYFEIRLS